MRTERELQQYYATDLKENLEAVELLRQKTKKSILLVLGPLVAVAVLFAIGYKGFQAVQGFTTDIPLVIVMALFLFAGAVYYGVKHKAIEDIMKEQIVTPLITFVNPSFQYSPADHVSESEFLESNFYHKSIVDHFRGDDLVEGYIGETHVRFSELTAQKVERTGDNKERSVTVFQGLFFVFDFKKDFEGSLYVMPKRGLFTGDHSSRMRKTNQTRERLHQVEMENGLFNDEFDVRSTDQHTARYVLTPALMEALMKLKQETEDDVMFSFVDGKMYLALHTGSRHFNFNMFTEIGEHTVLGYFNDLRYTFSIVDELQLNERLWNK